MLKVRIVAIGKDKDEWISSGVDHYIKLLTRWSKVEWISVTSPKKSSSLSPEEIKNAEAERLLEKVGDGLVVALTDSGRTYDSELFARRLQKWQTHAGGPVTFVIGGPFGLGDAVLRRADEHLSLSKLTFSHQVVRLVLLEQLYRALTILHGTDYHK